MIVYRLEHRRSGCGPWRHKPQGYEKNMRHTVFYKNINVRCNDELHLSVLEDKWLDVKNKHEYKCACANLLQFYFWFELDWIPLREYGFALYEIEAQNVVVGREQVIFKNVLSRREVSPEEYKNIIFEIKEKYANFFTVPGF